MSSNRIRPPRACEFGVRRAPADKSHTRSPSFCEKPTRTSAIGRSRSSHRISQTRCSKSRERASTPQLEVNRGLPVKKLIRYFERQGAVWTAKDELKQLIEFRKLNLTQTWPYMGQFDIVFIRNVMIYFDQDTKRDILQRIARNLSPSGYLFMGAAETVIGMGVPYQREELNGAICYRPTNG